MSKAIESYTIKIEGARRLQETQRQSAPRNVKAGKYALQMLRVREGDDRSSSGHVPLWQGSGYRHTIDGYLGRHRAG